MTTASVMSFCLRLSKRRTERHKFYFYTPINDQTHDGQIKKRSGLKTRSSHTPRLSEASLTGLALWQPGLTQPPRDGTLPPRPTGNSVQSHLQSLLKDKQLYLLTQLALQLADPANDTAP